MNKIELIVGLKIPDTTAITAYHTLEKLGIKELAKIKREFYYNFETSEGIDEFSKKVGKTDILVNANKNKFIIKKPNDGYNEDFDGSIVRVFVQDIEGGDGLLNTLRDTLGFKGLASVEKGMLWTIYLNNKSNDDALAISEKITKRLLYNKHYQRYRIIR